MWIPLLIINYNFPTHLLAKKNEQLVPPQLFVLVFCFVFFTCITYLQLLFSLVFFHSCTQRRDLPHQLVFSYPYCQAEWLAHCGNRLCEWQSNQSCLHHERRCIYDFSSLSVTPWFMPDHHAVSWIIIFLQLITCLWAKKKMRPQLFFPILILYPCTCSKNLFVFSTCCVLFSCELASNI